MPTDRFTGARHAATVALGTGERPAGPRDGRRRRPRPRPAGHGPLATRRCCPSLLPQPPPNAPPPTMCDRRSPCSPESAFLLEVSGFVVPPGYVGVDPATGARLAIGAAKTVAAFPVACFGERP